MHKQKVLNTKSPSLQLKILIWAPLSAFRSRFFLEKIQSFPRVNFSKKRAPLKSGRNDINCYFKKRAKLIFDFIKFKKVDC